MRFVIYGEQHIGGEIRVNGFKNAATPIIAATLLTKNTCVLKNVPRIGDVLTMVDILKSCGSEIKWLDDHVLEIKNENIDPGRINQRLVKQIRSSILLVGPMLARFKKFRFAVPGGCKIGSRPIDTHLEAFERLGAKVDFDKDTALYEVSLGHPAANKICLKEFSVTATENLLMLGAAYPLEIRLAACEPHVEDLGEFLVKALGIKIAGLGTHALIVQPPATVEKRIVEYQIINDPIEAGTFAILAATTKSKMTIRGAMARHLDAPFEKLKEFGVDLKFTGDDTLLINGKNSFLRAAHVQTLPYPGLPTDLQAPFGVLATQAVGQSLIFDTLYPSRLGYINELKAMGADAEILGPHRAVINGPTALRGAEITSLDLRAGATLVIAALVARGKTVIGDIEQIDRGYENLDDRLRALGADINRLP